MFFKIKFINILAVVFIVLLFTNLGIETFKDDETIIRSLYPTQITIEEKFNKALSEWGIIEDWIITKSLRNPTDSLFYTYEIKVPQSVPIPFLLNSVTENFFNEESEILCNERSINGPTTLSIYNNEMEMLRATFKYNDKITREAKRTAFILEDFSSLDVYFQDKLLKGIEPFGAVILPSKEAISLCNKIVEHNKEYLILLNDDIEEARYSLDPSKSSGALKNSVKALANEFKESAIFLIDKKSRIYNSAAFNFIRAEFDKYDIILYSKSRFLVIPDKEKSEVVSLFNFHFENEEVEKKLFRVNLNTFENLLPQLTKIRKKGHRIVLPSDYYN